MSAAVRLSVIRYRAVLDACCLPGIEQLHDAKQSGSLTCLCGNGAGCQAGPRLMPRSASERGDLRSACSSGVAPLPLRSPRPSRGSVSGAARTRLQELSTGFGSVVDRRFNRDVRFAGGRARMRLLDVLNRSASRPRARSQAGRLRRSPQRAFSCAVLPPGLRPLRRRRRPAPLRGSCVELPRQRGASRTAYSRPAPRGPSATRGRPAPASRLVRR